MIPITFTVRNIPFHVIVPSPEGGLTNTSAILCEAVRSISKDRLITRRGCVLPKTIADVEDRLRVLMGLQQTGSRHLPGKHTPGDNARPGPGQA